MSRPLIFVLQIMGALMLLKGFVGFADGAIGNGVENFMLIFFGLLFIIGAGKAFRKRIKKQGSQSQIQDQNILYILQKNGYSLCHDDKWRPIGYGLNEIMVNRIVAENIRKQKIAKGLNGIILQRV